MFPDRETLMAVSVEDPVEYNLSNVRQIQVDTQHGITFFSGLEVVLRMDPDVIVIGEIRDKDSADSAIRAATSGRIVLASIHANDAAGVVDSMGMLGISNSRLGSALRFIIGQDLVRTTCKNCTNEDVLDKNTIELFSKLEVAAPKTSLNANGCDDCRQTGYHGITGVFETIMCTPKQLRTISLSQGSQKFRDLLRGEGHSPLVAEAMHAVKKGLTTVEEAYTVHRPSSAYRFNSRLVIALVA